MKSKAQRHDEIHRVQHGRGLTARCVAFAAARADSGPSPTFTAGQCDPRSVPKDLAPRVRCGTVVVPRDYAHPDRGTFRLAVTVIASAVQPAAPEPDLYISGGPGGPLTVFAEAQARRPLAPDRDQILIDQRGTGASEPTLCPSFDRALVAASAAFDPAGRARRRELFQACRTEILASGIDLADFGTTVTVEDFEMVRRALGIARWNVFGVSYGTTVAMTLLALHPEPIRAAVLDSVYPPDPILPPWSQTAARARDAFLAACATAEGCRGLYPDLTEDYRAALSRLAATPISIAVPHGMNQPGDRAPLTPALFSFVVDRLTYYPNFYPGLPRLVAATRDGDTGPADGRGRAALRRGDRSTHGQPRVAAGRRRVSRPTPLPRGLSLRQTTSRPLKASATAGRRSAPRLSCRAARRWRCWCSPVSSTPTLRLTAAVLWRR